MRTLLAKKRECEQVFKILFFTVFIVSLLVGGYLTKRVGRLSDKNADAIEYIESWTVTDASGNSFKAGRTYEDERALTEDFVITAVLPDNISNGSILCFSNRSDVSVYINGSLRKEFKRSRDVNIPGGSLKDFYMTVPLKHSDAGAELKMIRYRTDWHPAVVSETFVTTNHGMNNYMAERYGLSFVMSVVLLVAALPVLFIGLVMRFWYRQPIDMLYAALGVADVALWLLSVSQFTPLITGIYFADGIMGFMFCMLMPFALLIYINAIQKQRYIRCYSALFMLSLTSFVLWTVLHFSGIQSFQTSLIYMDLILGLVIVSVLVTLIIDIRKGHTREYPYTALGFALFMVLSITEIVMLLVFELNSEIPILAGLLCLLILVMFQQVMTSERRSGTWSIRSTARSGRTSRCSYISFRRLQAPSTQRTPTPRVIRAAWRSIRVR